MLDHEYSVIGGFNRAHIGRLIGMLAAALSAGVWMLCSWLIEKIRGCGFPIPVVLNIPLTAGTIFLALYWYFNQSFWKLKRVSQWLKVPDLAGEWTCEGQTINADKSLGPQWSGTITISQSWDKVRVSLKTAQSFSDSITASLVHDTTHGFRLMYNYRNQPKIGETDLRAHLGYATFLFNEAIQTADGEYFNGNGRYTFGTMKLTRSV